jgi:WD40 repeat protein
MSMSTRRVIWYVVLPLLLVTVGLVAFWVFQSISSRNELARLETVTQLASVPVSEEPSCLAWSSDGSYLAAGTTKNLHNGGMVGPGKVFIVDVGKKAIPATLNTAGGVTGLAFSPDGKWLAVATMDFGGGKKEAELVVFAVPEFTAKLTAKAIVVPDFHFFVDLAWGADSKSVYAIDSQTIVTEKSAVRRWTVPEFVERPAIPVEAGKSALAVAPDGLTLAIVSARGFTGEIKLFNIEKATEISSIHEVPFGYHRVGFTTDSKTVGVFAGISSVLPFDLDGRGKPKPQIMSWWDVETGKLVRPADARFAVQPAGQMESRFYAISSDARTWARSGWGQDTINFTRTDPARTWTWRAGEGALAFTPNGALAFAPDATKLAGTLKAPTNWTIAIWAVP